VIAHVTIHPLEGEPHEMLVDEPALAHLYDGDVVTVDGESYMVTVRRWTLDSIKVGDKRIGLDAALFLTLKPCAPPEEVGGN
jgi:hypothetical protein